MIEEYEVKGVVDMVNSPPHYVKGGMEAIDVIENFLGTEGAYYYCRGNALKYQLRAGDKGSASEDHRKSAWYAQRAAGLWDEIQAMKHPEPPF